jgi:hypothetical protein
MPEFRRAADRLREIGANLEIKKSKFRSRAIGAVRPRSLPLGPIVRSLRREQSRSAKRRNRLKKTRENSIATIRARPQGQVEARNARPFQFLIVGKPFIH